MLLYKDGQKTLILKALDTNTLVFPYAVKNTANNMCIGFVTDVNRARSLRKASASIKAEDEKNITAVFARSAKQQLYHELIYVSNVHDVYHEDEQLLDKLDESIRIRFLKIITSSDTVCC